MSVSPSTTGIVQPAPRQRIDRTTVRRIVAVECDVIDATTELVYQRDDLAEAASPANNSLLERALRVEGLPPLARELIQAALLIEVAEDEAARRAERRRAQAHGSTRAATRGCEALLTGKDGES